VVISPVPSKRPRKLKFPQGCRPASFHGRIEEAVDDYVTSEAPGKPAHNCRAVTSFPLPHIQRYSGNSAESNSRRPTWRPRQR
jgi:hypothetical protein